MNPNRPGLIYHQYIVSGRFPVDLVSKSKSAHSNNTDAPHSCLKCVFVQSKHCRLAAWPKKNPRKTQQCFVEPASRFHGVTVELYPSEFASFSQAATVILMLDSYEIDNATISWACNVQLVTLPSPDGERSFENEWMHISVHILWSYQELIPLRLCNTAPVYCTRIITLHTQSNFERSGSSFPVKIMLWYFASRTKLILWTIRCTLLQAAPTILWKLCT